MDLKKNGPKLKDVRAPWDNGWGIRKALKPKNIWRYFIYTRKYGPFWAPSSLDPWRYRKLLKYLDSICLQSLKSHGALTAKELANWLNHDGALRMETERTGINQISIATARDWINLAYRRGLVIPWGNEAHRGRREGHWELTERGYEAIRLKFVMLVSQLPYASLATVLIAGGGIAASVFDWLSLHQVIVIWALALVLGIVIGFVWAGWSEKRENPGIAVVAIETLRSAGKPLPMLSG